VNLVIQAVEKMAERYDIKLLKIANRNNEILITADNIAGVDFEEDDDEDEEVDPPSDDEDDDADEDYEDGNEENTGDDDPDDEEFYDRIDQTELDELLREEADEPTPNIANSRDNVEEVAERQGEGASVTDSDATVDSTTLRRSTRSIIRPVRYGYHQDYQKKVSFAPDKVGEKQVESHHNLPTNMRFKSKKVIEYSLTSAQVAARFMTEANEKVSIQGASFAQQYSLQKGMQKFGKKGANAVTKELDQLHKRNCFVPIDVSKLTTSERKKAQHALMLLTEKRDGSVKGRCVYNRKPTRK